MVRKRIKESRVKKDLTQGDLAKSVNASLAAVANCERDNYPMDKLATIYRLCAALEVELTDVLTSITVIHDKPSPDAVISQDEKLSDKFRAELKEFIDDIKEGS